jgi:hypothetical protein
MAKPQTHSTRTIVQRELDEMVRECHGHRNLGRPRRWFAYFLKVLAGGAALLITFGRWPNLNQILGFVALAAVFADTVTSNHLRLIGETKAGHAYRRVLFSLAREHNRALDALKRDLDAAKDGTTRQEISRRIAELEASTHKAMTDRMAAIREALDEQDIKALQSLSLESESARARSPGPGAG